MPFSKLKLAWPLSLLVLPLANPCYGQHAEAPRNMELWPNSALIVPDQSGLRQAPAGKISAELLRYPLSAKSRHLLQKALQLSDRGDHAGAVKQLQKTLNQCPGTGAYVYSLQGVEYLKTDQIPEAVEALEQAVRLLPHDASNHANLGLALVSEGQYDRAEPELKRALDLDPHYAIASRLLGALALSRNAPK